MNHNTFTIICYVHTVCAASANTWGRLGKECRQDVSISVKVQSAKRAPTILLQC